MMVDKTRKITKTVQTSVTFQEADYKKALMIVAGVPDSIPLRDVQLDIENTYGGDITLSWTETTSQEEPLP